MEMSDDSYDVNWVTVSSVAGPEQRFVTAALQLLENGDSFDEVSVAQLAKAAGASVGAFYARFADKSALMHHLQRALYAEGQATLDRAFDLSHRVPVPLIALVRGFVNIAVSITAVQRGLRRAIFVQMTRDHVMRQRAVELSEITVARLVMLVAPHFPGASSERIALTMDTAHRIVTGALDQRLLFGAMSPTGRDTDDTATADELTAAVFAYMQTSLSNPAAPQL